MSAPNKLSFVTSREKVLLAYKGTPFTVMRVEQGANNYGPCWLVYVRFEEIFLEKIISLPATQRRDNAMNEIVKELEARGPLANITLCYRWRGYHFMPRMLWKRPLSFDSVLFLK
jgi:hypothetical protein